MTIIEIRRHGNGWKVFETLGVEHKVSLFPELALVIPVERREGGTFTVLHGLPDRLPNCTRQVQIRFGATSWGLF